MLFKRLNGLSKHIDLFGATTPEHGAARRYQFDRAAQNRPANVTRKVRPKLALRRGDDALAGEVQGGQIQRLAAQARHVGRPAAHELEAL